MRNQIEGQMKATKFIPMMSSILEKAIYKIFFFMIKIKEEEQNCVRLIAIVAFRERMGLSFRAQILLFNKNKINFLIYLFSIIYYSCFLHEKINQFGMAA